MRLADLPVAENVTLVNAVPSAMAQLLRMGGVPDPVRTVSLAGEPLKDALVQQTYRQETVLRVFNLYGPFEDTTYSTFALMEKRASEPPSIGRPTANTRIYLLDRHLQPVPIGVAGELHVGGVEARSSRRSTSATSRRWGGGTSP